MYAAITIVFLFMFIRLGVSLANLVSNPKLKRSAIVCNELVSILIPVRNEAHTILPLLHSIKAQDYTNYEVIMLDDNSTDDTYRVCAAFAATDNRFKIHQGKILPDGWLGKNFACHQLAQLAAGRYLLFLDADEKIYDRLICSAIARLKEQELRLLSLFTNQEMLTAGERMVVPVMNFILLNLLPLRLIRTSVNPAFAAASGQFMLFTAKEYHQHQWHLQVKEKVVEDIEIMRLIKLTGYKGETLLANGLISCRMYTNYRTAIAGFSKNFLAGFNYNIPVLLIFMVLLIGGPVLIISTLSIPLIVMMLVLVMLQRMIISYLSGQNLWYNCLLHPLQMFSLSLIGYWSVFRYISKTTVWKGRKV